MFSTLGNRTRFWLSPALSIAGLSALAGFFRFYRLHTLPLGLYHDEGMNGNDALMAIRTHSWHVFYPANNGREGLFINLQSLSVALFGATPWALRAVNALMGVLTVIGLFMLVRDLYDDRHALIAGVLHAVLIWPVITSRIGLRAQMSATVLVWLLWSVLRAYRLTTTARRPILWSLLSGALLAIGLNTYLAFRVVPVLIAVIAMLAWRANKTVRTPTVVILSTSPLLLAPLALFFLSHSEYLFAHTGDVSVFAQHHWFLGLGYNVLMELQMCFWRGDMNWRHNFGGAPMLPWLLMPFFLWGVAHAFACAKKDSPAQANSCAPLLFAWLIIGSLPGLLAESISQPHGLRLILISPLLSIVAAIGVERASDWFVRFRIPRIAVTTIVLLGLIGYEYDLYFNQYAESTEMHAAYSYPQYTLATSLIEHPGAKRRYVISPLGDTMAYGIPILAQSIAYLTHTLSPEAQDEKNIHYAIQGQVLASDSVELIPIPW